MYRLLLLDDEPYILNALRRCLTSIDARDLDGEALALEVFTSPEAAIARCDEQDFDLVVSDYRMPSMDGVEFLSRIMEMQPSAPRVIISAYADRDAIIAAINEAHLTRFIQKPWDDDELRKSVVAILTGARNKAQKTSGNDGAGRMLDDPGRQLRRLEQECPGITQLDQDEDGGILLSMDEFDFEPDAHAADAKPIP
jgi:two-component system probable response regulator PhcQ